MTPSIMILKIVEYLFVAQNKPWTWIC